MKYNWLAALLLFAGGDCKAATLQPEEADALFRAASQAAQTGRFDLAEVDFRRLLQQAPTARVKLELAHVLFLTGQNRESLSLFREVYEHPDTPAAVRRNVVPFVEELQLRLTRVRYGANVVTDNNPSRVSDGGTIYFNGVPLDYQPPRKKGTEYGVEPWVSVEKIWPSGLIGKFRGNARLFESPVLNSAHVYGSFAKRLPQVSGLFVQASIDAEVRQDGSYGLPTVESWQSFRLSDVARFGVGGQIGYLISENDGASGYYLRPYVFADWTVSDYATIFGQASVESLNSQDDYYSYTAPKLEVGVQLNLAGVEIVPVISATSTRFSEFDPFWGVTRDDLTIRSSLTIAHEELSYFGITPVLTVFHEDRDSSIDIHSYSQTGATVNFRKLF